MTDSASGRRRRRGQRSALLLAALVTLLALLVWRQAATRLPPPATAPAVATSATQRQFVVQSLTPAMQELATRPAPWTTGTFLDRPEGTDFRAMSYNVGWDSIFPAIDPRQAEKFQRVIRAVDPDVLALQEIRKSASDVAELLDAIAPLPDGQRWQVFKGQAGVIASKYPLQMLSDRVVAPSYRDPVAALVDLPDDRFEVDLYVLNNHFKCCDGKKNDPIRQQQADAVASRLRDVRTPGGEFDLPPGTPILVVGDLNLVGGSGPLETVLSGDIADEQRYGPDLGPDWDGTWLCDAQPLHNAAGPDDYTWRDDNSEFAPGRLDFVIYTDSVMKVLNAFVLNTTAMSADELSRSGLNRYDAAEDDLGRRFDHLPVVVDFRLAK